MKFFYDHYTSEQIAGLFGWEHAFTIALFAVLLTVTLYLSRRITEKGLQRLHVWIAVGVTVCEIVKISLRVIKGQGADSYMPLYYCSLFIYGVWMALCKNTFLSRTGYAFIGMGGAMAAFCFTAYPSTSLAIFPLWHPATWHSFFYHFVMCYTGILFLWKKRYEPKAKDGLGYFVFITAACVVAYFLNENLGTNCMFLRHAFRLPFLDAILQTSKWLYMAVVWLAQVVAMFWANFGLYKLFEKICRQGEKQ